MIRCCTAAQAGAPVRRSGEPDGPPNEGPPATNHDRLRLRVTDVIHSRRSGVVTGRRLYPVWTAERARSIRATLNLGSGDD